MWYCCYYLCGFVKCILLELPLSNLKEMICLTFDAKAVCADVLCGAPLALVSGHVDEKPAEKRRKTLCFFTTNKQWVSRPP